jgi:hypothetical protein
LQQDFWDCTQYYHTIDNVDAQPVIPYEPGTIEFSLFTKNWIDAVQWHLEDIIRDPNIEPAEALKINAVSISPIRIEPIWLK